MGSNLILIGINTLIGLAVIFWGISMKLKRAKMLKSGVRTTAAVTDVSVSKRATKRGSVTIYTCTVEYTANNKQITGKHSSATPYATGGTMEIAYLPETPEKFMTAHELDNTFVSKILPLIIIFSGIFAIIIAPVMIFMVGNR